MLHLSKLAVGVRDLDHLRRMQAERAEQAPPLRHRTRNMPRRAAEILEGGSLHWVICGMMLVRQRVVDIRPDRWDDGSACTGLILDPLLVPVTGRPVKAFQGWRYLEADDAPVALAERAAAEGEDTLPGELRQALRDLCLL